MKTETHFDPNTNRYAFDFRLCPFSRGWAQLDTSQDAPWYGNWINPFTRQLAGFAEGDITVVTCESNEEFAAKVEETVAWHRERGFAPAIDGMCSEAIVARFHELGLGHLLH